jgi:peroxiredoxin
MKKVFTLLLIVILVAGCRNKENVTIKGSFTGKAPVSVVLSRNDVDRAVVIDSVKVKKNHFSFKTKITEPEFFQVSIGKNDFVSLLASPGEKINLAFKGTPLINNYTVTGSKSSEQVQQLDLKLIETKNSLDSLRRVYKSLNNIELTSRGPALEKTYTDIIADQRLYNIRFILQNLRSMASIKALYQRIDENMYVLYQPRDLQYLKVVSDSLSAVYPESKHVKALLEDVKKELNQMYLNNLTSIAATKGVSKFNPILRNIYGERVSLESLRGKYVLLTFFATSSDASMKENDQLKALWNQYHNKGLEIYQISLDTDINRWISYVKYEELPWISVIEDDPANPAVAKSLAIASIPANFLIDREGNIINSNLHDRNLNIMMDQIFNK